MWIGSNECALRIHIFPFFNFSSFHFYLIFLTPSFRHWSDSTLFYFHLILFLVAFAFFLFSTDDEDEDDDDDEEREGMGIALM